MGLLGSSVGSLRDIVSLWGAPWGPLWRSRGVIGAVLGCLGQAWRLSWRVMDRPKKAQWRLGGALGAILRVLKTLKNHWFLLCFEHLEVLGGTPGGPWGSLGAPWEVLGKPGGVPGRSFGALGVLRGSLGRPW